MASKTLKRFAISQSGNAAMLFALMLIPILLIVGFALDSSRQVSANRHVQSAIDAAALAGARAMEDATLADAEIEAIALAAYRGNLQTAHADLACLDPTINVSRTLGTVQIDASCEVPTVFGASFTKDTMPVEAGVRAKAAITKLDLALMLDVSGSMGGQKLVDLKDAAKEAAAKLITPQTGDRVRISFASYSTSVNAGVYGRPALGQSFDASVTKTCVSERAGGAAWKDDGPEIGKWVGDKASSCPNSSIMPLTYDRSAFDAGIDSLTAGGWTAGHLGVAWAWYLISPDWDSIWPAASEPHDYTEPNVLKAVILMTDGQFNTAYESGMGNSNEQAKKLCKEMRDEGVLVYAVAFQAPTSAKNTLKNCTGDDDRFFDAANGDELKAAYRTIASQLSALSLVG